MAELIESPAGEYCRVEDSPGIAMIAWAGEIPFLSGAERDEHIAAMYALASYYLGGPQRRAVRFLVENTLGGCAQQEVASSTAPSGGPELLEASREGGRRHRSVRGQVSPADLLAQITAAGGRVLAGTDHRGHAKVQGANGVKDWVNVGHRKTMLGAGLANQLLRKLGAVQDRPRC